MIFQREIFFSKVRPVVEVGSGAGLTSMQVDGLNRLIDFIEADPRWDGMDCEIAVRILSYLLGTIAHECTIKVKIGTKNVYVKSFQPVEEMGGNAYLNRMYDTRTDLGNTRAKDGDGARNAGDGYVQNTGGTNARTTGRLLAGMEITYADIPADKSDLLAAFAREGGSARTPITIDGNTFIREHELLRVPHISYLDAVDGMLTGRYTGKAIGEYINERKTDYTNARRVINRLDKAAVIAGYAKQFEKVLFASVRPGKIAGKISAPQAEPERPEAEIIDPALPVDLPVKNEGEAGGETALVEAKPPEENHIKTLIPHIDTLKGWLWKMLAGTGLGTAYAYYAGLPPELRYALLGLVFLIVAGSIYALIKYNERVFGIVREVMKINADPTTPNVQLVAHKRGE